ncbi:hypothetical protein GCM10010168_56420 [Actinoplanes ianthinogenes]|uniref:DUF5682 family protein n=1 Tax=Actinoplanes ianthinogenes TaxID=122358 RepID=UPI001670C5FC|nr:DUF5682 family protein [Actinoplanes ianthinogenes]GGR31023.1 hypothetical protein GCM10010168_56420 [Actinoplanes ianthinogenes]
MSSRTEPGPREAVDGLAGDGRVQLIGVRHHSPVLAAAVPALLDAFRPATVLVELPAEMQSWITWLADPGTVAPVALAAAGTDGALAFYPFADFSPELAAVRWARAHDVPVVCGDLPLTDPGWAAGRRVTATADGSGPGLGAAVHATVSGRAGDDLWDRWIEAAAPGSSPEAVRRAALAAGWALRQDAGRDGIDPVDLRREAWMRAVLGRTGGRVAAVIGAFHAPALLDPSLPLAGEPAIRGPEPVVSLVPYTFDLLDARSGYPAGIRDPRWQQAVFEGGAAPGRVRAAADRFAVEVTRALRERKQPAGPGEAAEVARLAGDLAGLRGLPAPGRGELVEALQTVLAQGSPTGAGRTVAQAMADVLIGRRRGRLPAGAPVTGLRPAVERELAALKLPGPGDPSRRIRLDPLRSPTDRARELAIRRLAGCGAPYAEAGPAGPVAGGETLTTTWQARWTPSTDAALALAGLHGVTLAQAAAGMLAARRRREERAGGPTPDQALTGLAEAAACGLPELAVARLSDVRRAVCQGGAIQQIIAAVHLLGRIERGHVPGLTEPLDGLVPAREELHAAAVAAVDGLAGSDRVEDARALLDLVQSADEAGRRLRLGRAVRGLVRDGSPLMSGAASAVGVLLDHETAEAFGTRLASWADAPDKRAVDRLRGALSVTGALLQAGGDFLDPLLDTVERMPDDAFVRRLPGLRGGFDVLSPGDRDRLLRTVGERHGTVDDRLSADAVTLASWIAADRAGLAALDALGLAPGAPALTGGSSTIAAAAPALTHGSRPLTPGAATGPADAAASTAGPVALPTDASPTPGAATHPTDTSPAPGPAALPTDATPTPGATTDRANTTPTPGPTIHPTDATPTPGAATHPANTAPTPGAATPTPGVAIHPANTTATPGAATHPANTAPTPGAATDPTDTAPAPGAATDPTDTTATPGAATDPTDTAPAPGAATDPTDTAPAPGAATDLTDTAATPGAAEGEHGGGWGRISPGQRWRLLLGRESEHLEPEQRRMAAALDELYGAGRGEGAYTVDSGGAAGGGRERAYPEIRDWLADLEDLFGTAVRDEVLARAAERGRLDAVLAADPEQVRPSIDLLHAVLSMAGGLPEARLAKLRPLVARLTAELTAQLARRIRPALTGLGTPRPTRRPSGRLDLAATVRQNLHTVRTDPAGRPRIIPDRPVFRSPGRRNVDWQVILLVDVSGSMEESTIWAALTASVLAGVPALRTHFVTFSTEVIDLTDRVTDALSLLLEIKVGGGTHIAAGLRYARQITTVPSRTLVITISDFEEGYPVADLLGAARALVDDGVTLLGCASLNDKGQPRFSTGIASQLVGAGMPVAALSPSELAGWIGERVR